MKDEIIDSKISYDNSFKIRYRMCDVLEDRIELDPVVRFLGLNLTGVSLLIVQLLTWSIYLSIAIFTLFMSYRGFMNDDITHVVYFGFFGTFFLYRLVVMMSYSNTNVVMRDTIQRIERKEAGRLIKVRFFVVHFLNEKGKKKKLALVLPRFAYGELESEKAIAIFTREGLYES